MKLTIEKSPTMLDKPMCQGVITINGITFKTDYYWDEEELDKRLMEISMELGWDYETK